MSRFTVKMAERIERQYAALDLGHLEPIRGLLYSYCCDNAADSSTIRQLQCVIGTAEAYVDCSDDYEWIEEALTNYSSSSR